MKFADDAMVVGLMRDDNDQAYREEVEQLVDWWRDNSLILNVEKTKDIIVDFRKNQVNNSPLLINSSAVSLALNDCLRFISTVGQQERSSSLDLLPPDMSELRLVLLGNNPCQRNQVGNIILGGTVFTEVPDCCVKVRGRTMWKPTVLINTPDLLHLNVSEDKVAEHVEQCVRLSDPGPHVFLLVLQPEDFTELQKERLKTVLENCGDRSFEHSLVLISTPKKENYAEAWLDHPPLKQMIKLCRYRYVLQKNLDLQELFVRCRQILRENDGKHVICDLSDYGAAHSDPNELAGLPANFNPAKNA
ncbi:PREDICTED: GTPase IMAP family member 5-like, partial [Cyprinodon variegatus]|uniref:GTPase IMAP family member 5-like n=1 Tax=Cyprinodon variegatus TaxID=28743 RepID=UPI00074251E5